MISKNVLIVPPIKLGGGPSNAVARIRDTLEYEKVGFTTNVLSRWNVALINVGTGIRFDVIRKLKFSRRLVYRVDGSFSKQTFVRQNRQWQSGFDQRNKRIALALEIADFVIYQSNFSKNNLDLLYKRLPGTYTIIPNGIDLTVFSPANKIKSDIPVLGCIGTFRENRILHLLDIAKTISFQHKLLLVGRMDQQCQHDLENYNQKDLAHCHLDVRPAVTGDYELVSLYREIDCFLHPVIGDTCSNAVIEALACGVPVVIPAWSGSSELIEEGGVIIQQSPWEDYQSYLQEYAQSAESVILNQASFSSLARNRACSAFDIHSIAASYRTALGI